LCSKSDTISIKLCTLSSKLGTDAVTSHRKQARCRREAYSAHHCCLRARQVHQFTYFTSTKGTQFTCFTSTKVQILTPSEELSRCRNARASRCDSARRLLARRVLAASEVQALLAALLKAYECYLICCFTECSLRRRSKRYLLHTYYITCFASTKVLKYVLQLDLHLRHQPPHPRGIVARSAGQRRAGGWRRRRRLSGLGPGCPWVLSLLALLVHKYKY
jgi:hypothetical protein